MICRREFKETLVTRPLIRIGTRASALALAQANEAIRHLRRLDELDSTRIEIVKFMTTGDRVVDRPIREIAGKGVFCTEIENALINGQIDLAVHSMKDMPVKQPEGLVIDCVLPRSDPRDALVGTSYESLDILPDDFRVGTSSIRRRKQVLFNNPFVEVLDIRGNIQTRISKCRNGDVDCLILAMAGLQRLAIRDIPIHPVPVDVMTPAPAQGVICIERRADDDGMARMTGGINDQDTMTCVLAERAVLECMGGSCEMPLAAHARLEENNSLKLTADHFYSGQNCSTSIIQDDRSNPVQIGIRVAKGLKG